MKSLSQLSLKLWAIAANSGTALSSFVLGLMVLHGSAVADYGTFAFILVLQWLGCGVINAVCGAPLLIGYRDQQLTMAKVRPFFWLALVVIVLIAAVQALVLMAQQFPVIDALIYAVAVSAQLLRWFARSYLQNNDPALVLKADAVFAMAILPLAAVAMLQGSSDLRSAGLVLMVGSLIAVWPVRQFLLVQLTGPSEDDFFRRSMQRQAKPALIGVLTVEATSNIHSYLIVLTLGTAAFAPVAAAALFLRPMNLIQSSIAQIERPQIAKAIATLNQQALSKVMTPFYRYCIYAFIANVLGFMLLAYVKPDWLWPEPSQWSYFLLVAVLVVATNLLRSLRLPASTLVQCFDQFSFLARVTVVSSAITLPLVAIALWWFGVIGALISMFFGELLVTLPILLQSRRCQKEFGARMQMSDSPV
jgi:hypothetical protein